MRSKRLPKLLITAVALLSLAAVTPVAGGCSFDTSASGLECNEEGARRAGERCQDGYWRVVPDAALDSEVTSDVSDGPSDVERDSRQDSAADSCADITEREHCEQRGMPCAQISFANPCGAGGLTVDCAQFFDFDNDPQHCGGCDESCAVPGAHAEAICEQGSCDIECDEGFVDANGDVGDGCEEACSPTNGGVEICDGLDNDCDGSVDEDAEDAQPFFRDGDGDGYGVPTDSTRACDAPEDFVGNADDCDDDNPQINPSADEICDGDIDHNCDNAVDEDCPCTNDETRPCGTDEGACQKGTQTCTGGQWEQECSGATGPQAEQCDGVDNNCNGSTDEDFSELGAACTVGTGACEANGTRVCSDDGSGTQCDASPGIPSQEVCDDGIDNNCDGAVDEGCSCDYDGESSGVCGTATRDSSGVCQQPGNYESDEASCDGFDNDCDDATDENCPCDYDNKTDGVCGAATRDSSGECEEPDNYESSETTCDGIDNDCDGLTDENLTVLRYPDDDGDGFGVTGAAAMVCPSTAGWVAQNGDCDDTDPWTYSGADEVCDGKDNNCNGIERDDGGRDAGDWCENQYGLSNVYCGGPNSGTTHICCEISDDGNLGCDYETVCHNNVDEDNDGDYDCADSDCDGLYCEPGKVCDNGTCQAI